MSPVFANMNSPTARIIPALLFVLLFIWQVPGTIALRNAVLGALFLLTAWLWLRNSNRLRPKRVIMQPPMLCLLLLTGWLVLSLSWAVEPRLSLVELKGQWVMPVLCGITGALMATVVPVISRNEFKGLVQVVFWALFLQIGLHDLLDIAYWINTGATPFRQAPVLYLPDIARNLLQRQPLATAFSGESGDKFSYVNNTLAALIVAELVQRILLKKRWLDISWPTLLLASMATLACTYWLQFRNGNVGLLLLIAFALFMVLVRLAKNWPIWKTATTLAIAIALLVTFANVLYKSDARWQSFTETVAIAVDTSTHQAWRLRGTPYPLMQNGQTVDVSAYERLAWGTEGLKLVADHPFGTGYNRNAFGDGIDRKYQMNGVYRGGHAHSGLIDFAIANGVPGLIMWLAFLGALFYTGWVAFMGGQIAPALALMFIVSGFFSRSMVDSNIRDHMLQQFMFLSLFFAVALKTTRTASGRADD